MITWRMWWTPIQAGWVGSTWVCVMQASPLSPPTTPPTVVGELWCPVCQAGHLATEPIACGSASTPSSGPNNGISGPGQLDDEVPGPAQCGAGLIGWPGPSSWRRLGCNVVLVDVVQPVRGETQAKHTHAHIHKWYTQKYTNTNAKSRIQDTNVKHLQRVHYKS